MPVKINTALMLQVTVSVNYNSRLQFFRCISPNLDLALVFTAYSLKYS